MRCTILFFCVLTLMSIKNGRALRVDYMTNFNTKLEPSRPSLGYLSSGIVKSHYGVSYPSSFNKTLTVSAPFGYSLLVSIRLIDLRPMKQDELMIFAPYDPMTRPMSFSNSDYFKNKRYYPNEEVAYYAPKGNIGIRFTTGPLYTSGYGGFELIYTVQESRSFCLYDEFRCNNGRCISEDLTCDGHNHCGDQSSNRNCYSNNSVTRKIGISFGVVFLVIAIACGIYIGIRKARGGGTDTHTIITSHPPPTTNLPTYPPAYPQPGTCYPPPPPPYSQGLVNPTYH